MSKREAHHTHHPAHVHQHHAGRGIEESIMHNLVQLQKVHTDLADKFDKLANQISQLLSLFEITARTFSQQTQSMDKDKEFLDKIDTLLEQNKTIAKGLTLVEEKMREKLYGGNSRPPMPQMMMPQNQMMQTQYKVSPDQPRPLPRQP